MSGQVRIPPPSRLFRLPVIKQNKAETEVTQALPLPHTIPAQSRWLCSSQYLTAKVLGYHHCVRVFPPICLANDLRCWLPDSGCLVCTETVNSVTHKYCTGRTASGGGLLNKPEMIVTYLCCGKRYSGVKRVNTGNPAPSWSNNAATTLKTLQRSPAETSCCKSPERWCDVTVTSWPCTSCGGGPQRAAALTPRTHAPLSLI